MCSVEGADVLIEGGVALVIQENNRTRDGAGVLVLGQGASLNHKGFSHRIHFPHNKATRNGQNNTAYAGVFCWLWCVRDDYISQPVSRQSCRCRCRGVVKVMIMMTASAFTDQVLEIIVNSLNTKRSFKVQDAPHCRY